MKSGISAAIRSRRDQSEEASRQRMSCLFDIARADNDRARSFQEPIKNTVVALSETKSTS